MTQAHLWTEEARDVLRDAASDMVEIDDEERELVIAAINRLPLDTIVEITPEEWDRLNSEPVPMEERSDAARAFLVADLIFGPGQWIDSQEIGEAMGEWFTREN